MFAFFGLGIQELIIILVVGLAIVVPGIVGIAVLIYLLTKNKNPPK